MEEDPLIPVPLSTLREMMGVRNRIEGYYSGVDDDLFSEIRQLILTHQPPVIRPIEKMYFCPLCEGKSRMFTKQALKQHRKDKHPGGL